MSYIGYKAQGMGFDAHLTILYLGRENLGPEKELEVVDFLEGDSWLSAPKVMRQTIDLFGPNNDIPVIRVMVPPELTWLRNEALKEFGNGSEFKDWNPHITLDLIHLDIVRIPFEIQLTDLGLY
jgi:2'-5' RNA ligase